MLESKKELLVEIQQRYETRGLGYLDASGQRVSQIGGVGEALMRAAERSQEPSGDDESAQEV